MSERPYRLPWPITIAALIAMSTLATNAGAGPLVAGLAFAFLWHRFLDLRLPVSAWPAWVVRVPLFASIVFLRTRYGPAYDGRLWGAPMDLAGELCAAELVIQAWGCRATGTERDGAAVLLSMICIVAGSNVYQSAFWPHAVLPLYFVFLIPSLRGLRGRGAWSRGHGVRYIAGVWLALVGGGATAYEIWDHRAELMMIDSRFLAMFLDPRVGFSDEPSLGRGPGGRGGLDRVLRVEGDLAEPHLRGATFDDYAKGVWGPRLSYRRVGTATPEWLKGDARGPWTRVTRLTGSTILAFLPLHCAGIRVEGAVRRETGGTRVLVEGEPPVSWSAAADADPFHQGPLCAQPSADELSHCLAVPESVRARLIPIALEIIHSPMPPGERVRAVHEYLQKNHKYSLKFEPREGDPVADFLERKAAAHCEYFGASAVLLLRCVGVPARYVVGYYCHERAGGGEYVVRSRDAHAWAEAWVEDQGWVTVDATPAEGMPGEEEEGPSWMRKFWERAKDLWDDVLAWIGRLHTWGILGLAVALMAAAAGVLTVLRWWRRRRPRRARGAWRFSTPEGFEALAARFERHLKRRGIALPEGRTWREVLPAGAERSFVERYNSVRFGGRPLDGLVKTLEAELKTLEERR